MDRPGLWRRMKRFASEHWLAIGSAAVAAAGYFAYYATKVTKDTRGNGGNAPRHGQPGDLTLSIPQTPSIDEILATPVSSSLGLADWMYSLLTHGKVIPTSRPDSSLTSWFQGFFNEGWGTVDPSDIPSDVSAGEYTWTPPGVPSLYEDPVPIDIQWQDDAWQKEVSPSPTAGDLPAEQHHFLGQSDVPQCCVPESLQ